MKIRCNRAGTCKKINYRLDNISGCDSQVGLSVAKRSLVTLLKHVCSSEEGIKYCPERRDYFKKIQEGGILIG